MIWWWWILAPALVRGDCPTSYDARKEAAHPECISGAVIDQGECESCYALAVSGATSDRLCLSRAAANANANASAELVLLSPQDLTSCGGGNGCEDGSGSNSITVAYQQVVDVGVATHACMPWASSTGVTGECQAACADGSAKTKWRATTYASISRRIRTAGVCGAVMEEIARNGPITAGFSIQTDFWDFKHDAGGVYYIGWNGPVDRRDDNHAVKVIGWGTMKQKMRKPDGGAAAEADVPYWLCLNSWGDAWGVDGTFKMIREADSEKEWYYKAGYSGYFEDAMVAATGPFTSYTCKAGDEDCVSGSIVPDARFPCTGDSDDAVDQCTSADKAELKKYDALMAKAYGKDYAGADEVKKLL